MNWWTEKWVCFSVLSKNEKKTKKSTPTNYTSAQPFLHLQVEQNRVTNQRQSFEVWHTDSFPAGKKILLNKPSKSRTEIHWAQASPTFQSFSQRREQKQRQDERCQGGMNTYNLHLTRPEQQKKKTGFRYKKNIKWNPHVKKKCVIQPLTKPTNISVFLSRHCAIINKNI